VQIIHILLKIIGIIINYVVNLFDIDFRHVPRA
jgi:hypothetical protein